MRKLEGEDQEWQLKAEVLWMSSVGWTAPPCALRARRLLNAAAGACFKIPSPGDRRKGADVNAVRRLIDVTIRPVQHDGGIGGGILEEEEEYGQHEEFRPSIAGASRMWMASRAEVTTAKTRER